MEKPIEPGNTTKLKINFELRTFRSREKFRTYIWAKTRSSFEYSRDEISRLPLEFSCKTPWEEGFGLLEFEKKLTHIFNGSGVSIIRSTRGSFVRNEKRERGGKRKKRKVKEEIRRKFSRETFTSATLILTAGEFFTGKLALEEERIPRVRAHQS